MPITPAAVAVGSRRKKTRYAPGSVTDVTTNVSGIIAFHDAATNVTLNGSTVTQIDDARGAGGHLPLVGFGTPTPSYNSTSKVVTTDGGQNYLKTATDARFALNTASCFIYIGNVQGNYAGIVSTDTVSDYGGFTRAGGGSPYYFAAGSSCVAPPQSDLALDSSIHLHRYAQHPPPAQHGDGGTLNWTVGYYSVGDDIRKWTEQSSGAGFGTGACSVAVGHVPGNTTYAPAQFLASLVLDHDPTPSEWAAIQRFATARGAVSLGTRSFLVCVGDSITYGQGCTTPSTDAWPNLMAAQFANYAVDKRGRSGRWCSEILTQVQDLVLNDANGNIATKWVIPWCGTNDIVGGHSATTVFAQLQSICQQAMDAGIRVFVPTMMKRSDCTGAAETARQAFNASILQMVTNGQATQVCDIAATVDPTNVPTVSSDGTHPNTTWNVTIKNTFVTALQNTGKF